VSRLGQRSLRISAVATLALLALLFPPWRARAIRTTTRYAAISGVAPSIVVDTIDWLLPFAPVYAPPRATLSGDRMRELSARAVRGDPEARRILRDSTRPIERRYRAPEVLRTDGALWRDSVLSLAGIPAISSYDLAFTIDERWVAARLSALALVGVLVERWARRRGAARDVRH
jgi:hypothetical protein